MNFANVSKYFLIIQPFPLFLFIILNMSSRIRPCFRFLFLPSCKAMSTKSRRLYSQDKIIRRLRASVRLRNLTRLHPNGRLAASYTLILFHDSSFLVVMFLSFLFLFSWRSLSFMPFSQSEWDFKSYIQYFTFVLSDFLHECVVCVFAFCQSSCFLILVLPLNSAIGLWFLPLSYDFHPSLPVLFPVPVS